MVEQFADTTERRVGLALVGLRAEGWALLHDVHVPGRRAAVDHVAVGPPGVYAVCIRPWQGRVRERDVAEALAASRAVASVCPAVARDYAWPVLCFDTGEPLDTWVHGVVVAAPSTLVELVTARRTVLDPAEVCDVAAELEALEAIGSATPDVKRVAGSHRAEADRRGVALRLVKRPGPVASHP